jgi:hypothetical protein
LKEEGERKREEHIEKEWTYLLCFFKKEGERERRRRRRTKKRGVSLPLFKGLETDYPCDLQHP